MGTRSLLRATFDIGRTNPFPLPPPFLLPRGARLHQAAASSPTDFQRALPGTTPQGTNGLIESVTDARRKTEEQCQTTRSEPQPHFMDAQDKPFPLGHSRPPPRPEHAHQQATPSAAVSAPPSKPLVLSKSLH